jgi:hypothetical protein
MPCMQPSSLTNLIDKPISYATLLVAQTNRFELIRAWDGACFYFFVCLIHSLLAVNTSYPTLVLLNTSNSLGYFIKSAYPRIASLVA